MSVADLCRKHGVSDPSIYHTKAPFGGTDVSKARRLEALEDENTRLKRTLADAIRYTLSASGCASQSGWLTGVGTLPSLEGKRDRRVAEPAP